MTVKIYLVNGRIIRLKCDKAQAVNIEGENGSFNLSISGNVKEWVKRIRKVKGWE